MAEAHPVGFRWVMKARERGATIINVDPHYARTAAMSRSPRADPAGHRHRVPGRADPPRPRDRVLLQGLRRRTTPTRRRSSTRTSATPRTSAAASRASTPRRGPTTARAGCTRAGRARRPRACASTPRRRSASATGAGMETEGACAATRRCSTRAASSRSSSATTRATRRRWSSEVCGIPQEAVPRGRRHADRQLGPRAHDGAHLRRRLDAALHRRADIRAGAIVQLLLGNIGRPGGGIMAMRGHATIQGSTDIPTLYDLLPGYLPMPRAREEHLTLEDYCSTGGAAPRLVVALRQLRDLAAEGVVRRRGDGRERLRVRPPAEDLRQPLAVPDDDAGARRRHRRHVRVRARTRPSGRCTRGLMRRALGKLKWLVVRDLADIETSRSGRTRPRSRSGELRSEDIGTEVFLLPAASHIEKEGTFTNTQRLVQWRDKALERRATRAGPVVHLPPDRRVKAHYADSTAERDWPIRNLRVGLRGARARSATARGGRPAARSTATTWPPAPPCPFNELRGGRLHGLRLLDLLRRVRRRRQPGAPARARRRRRRGNGLAGVGLGLAGQPPHPLQPRLRRPARASRGRSASSMSGGTTSRPRGRATTSPTSRSTSRPDYRAPADDGDGHGRASRGDDPFIMMADGRAWLYTPTGLLDGPLPTHYEPIESPVPTRCIRRSARTRRRSAGSAPRTRSTPIGERQYPHRAPPSGSPSTTRPGR